MRNIAYCDGSRRLTWTVWIQGHPLRGQSICNLSHFPFPSHQKSVVCTSSSDHQDCIVPLDSLYFGCLGESYYCSWSRQTDCFRRPLLMSLGGPWIGERQSSEQLCLKELLSHHKKVFVGAKILRNHSRGYSRNEIFLSNPSFPPSSRSVLKNSIRSVGNCVHRISSNPKDRRFRHATRFTCGSSYATGSSQGLTGTMTAIHQ